MAGTLTMEAMTLAFERLAHEMIRRETTVLRRVAEQVQRDAKAKFGEYQEGGLGYLDWAPLAASTVAEKERLGFAPPDKPLLRTGRLRDSIDIRVDESAGEAQVGSNEDVMVWQELGTDRLPPRSVLGLTGAQTANRIEETVGPEIAAALRLTLP